MDQFYPGQRVIGRDGAQYVLAFHMEGIWFGFAMSGQHHLPRPVEPRYPAWGGDDDRAGTDFAVGARTGQARGRGGVRRGHRARRG